MTKQANSRLDESFSLLSISDHICIYIYIIHAHTYVVIPLVLARLTLVILTYQIKECKGLNINCVDSHGNSALHLAAYRDQQKMAAFLMQAGVKSDIKNFNGMKCVLLLPTAAVSDSR